MTQHPKSGARQPNGSAERDSRGKRQTIGLLIGLMDERYQSGIWPGVVDVAEEQDLNLICFAGNVLNSPYSFDAQGTVLYGLAGPENVDGLVILTGSIGGFIKPEEMAQFCKRYHPLPVSSIGLALEGIPSITVDNYKGMYDSITHLVELHGYRRIAFIRGTAGHHEAEERYRAYQDVLAEHGIPLDLDLVYQGDFWEMTGGIAIRDLLDQRQVDFEAVVAANDAMALGALTVLQERGIRVPYDVAIAGFDDVESACYSTPPLTTVRQPLYDMGRQAAELLLRQLRGEEIPLQNVLPTELVVRQSCGCFSATTIEAAAGKVTPADGSSFESAFAARRETIHSEMYQVLTISLEHLPPKRISAWIDHLLDAFESELSGGMPDTFLSALDKVLYEMLEQDDHVAIWQTVLSTMRHQLLPCLANPEHLAHSEDIWQQARVLIGEAAQRVQAYRRLLTEQHSQILRGVDQALITTTSLEELVDAAVEVMPQLGIERCYLSLYEGERPAPPPWSQLLLAYDQAGEIGRAGETERFPSRQLVPEGLLAQERRYTLVAQPLYFREDQLGFGLFEMGPPQGIVYRALSEQISSALKSALLAQEREQLLADVENRALHLQIAADVSRAASSILDLEELIQKVVDLLCERFQVHYAGLFLVDETGQRTGQAGKWALLRAGSGEAGRRMVAQGHKIEIGGSSMIGWCIANREARFALDVAQDPLHLKNPLLPDTRSEMSLPLCLGDRIIGALDVQSQEPSAFYESNRIVLQTVADQLAVAIENARSVSEMRRLNEHLQQTLDIQERLLETIEALSTPVVPLLDGIILLPLVGNIDSGRAQQIMEQLLEGVQKHHARVAILDITGIPVVDTHVANSLLRAAQATNLLGAEVILVGIRPEVAQTIVGLGVNLSLLSTTSNLQSGIEYALRRLGRKIQT